MFKIATGYDPGIEQPEGSMRDVGKLVLARVVAPLVAVVDQENYMHKTGEPSSAAKRDTAPRSLPLDLPPPGRRRVPGTPGARRLPDPFREPQLDAKCRPRRTARAGRAL